MRKKRRQRVSVVLCTYNGEQFLDELLESITWQAFTVYEIIVQDDGSTDKTIAIVKRYMRRFPFIKLYINEERLGPNQNYLSAIQKATGEMIAIANQDEVWNIEKIGKQVERYNEGYSMVFHNTLLFEVSPEQAYGQRYKEISVLSELSLLLKPRVRGPECLFTPKALPLIAEVCKVEPTLPYAYAISLACIALGKVSYIDEGLVYWRQHPQTTDSNVKRKTYGAIEGMLRSIGSLYFIEKRITPWRFYHAVAVLPFKTKRAKRLITLMQDGTVELIGACWICSWNVSDFYEKATFRNWLKATFAPLHIMRDGNFLLK